jgi:hypothetical protein
MDARPDSTVPRLSWVQAGTRMAIRTAFLLFLAAIGARSFTKNLELLSSIAAFYCAFIAAIRRQPLVGPAPTQFDEAAVFGLIACAASWAA